MYETFFGLRERPFDLSPNARFLFLTSTHRRALINLEGGIATRKGVVVLIGEPGTGKTTVARALMAKRRAMRTKFIYLNHSLSTPVDFRRFLARALELGPLAETSNTDLIYELTDKLLAYRQEETTVALIVDEAQSLSDDVLEEVRLLTNVETNDGKLLTLVLIGQPKLALRLNEETWKQLKQRIEVRSTLTALELTETAAYIWSRIRVAGGDASRLFTGEAVRLVHERSRGIARSISVICENALMSGFAEQERPLTKRLVLQVCEELDFPGEEATTTATARSTGILHIPLSPEGSRSGQAGRLWRTDEQPTERSMAPPAVAQPKRRWSFLSSWSLLSRVGFRL